MPEFQPYNVGAPILSPANLVWFPSSSPACLHGRREGRFHATGNDLLRTIPSSQLYRSPFVTSLGVSGLCWPLPVCTSHISKLQKDEGHLRMSYMFRRRTPKGNQRLRPSADTLNFHLVSVVLVLPRRPLLASLRANAFQTD